MSRLTLKNLARQVFKVLPGGPTTQTRGADVLAFLDQFIDEAALASEGGAAELLPVGEGTTSQGPEYRGLRLLCDPQRVAVVLAYRWLPQPNGSDTIQLVQCLNYVAPVTNPANVWRPVALASLFIEDESFLCFDDANGITQRLDLSPYFLATGRVGTAEVVNPDGSTDRLFGVAAAQQAHDAMQSGASLTLRGSFGALNLTKSCTVDATGATFTDVVTRRPASGSFSVRWNGGTVTHELAFLCSGAEFDGSTGYAHVFQNVDVSQGHLYVTTFGALAQGGDRFELRHFRCGRLYFDGRSEDVYSKGFSLLLKSGIVDTSAQACSPIQGFGSPQTLVSAYDVEFVAPAGYALTKLTNTASAGQATPVPFRFKAIRCTSNVALPVGQANQAGNGLSVLSGAAPWAYPAAAENVFPQGDRGGAGGGTSNELQIRSTSSARVATVDVTGTLQLLSAAATASRNASGVEYQVNYYDGGTWVAGTVRTTLADANADLAALTAPQKAAGAELLIKTIAVTAADSARIILTLTHG